VSVRTNPSLLVDYLTSSISIDCLESLVWYTLKMLNNTHYTSRTVALFLSIIFILFIVFQITKPCADSRRGCAKGYLSVIMDVTSVPSYAEMSFNKSLDNYGKHSYESVCEDELIIGVAEMSASDFEKKSKVIFSADDETSSDYETVVCHDTETEYVVIAPLPDPFTPWYKKSSEKSYCVDSSGFRGYVDADVLGANDVTCN